MPAQPNQSLIDGLACLQALASAGEDVGVREMARQLGFEPTRVSRLLGTLASIGMARRLTGGRYESGPGVHVLSAQSMFASGLLGRAVDCLEPLIETGLSVAMGVLWRDSVAYLYHRSPGQSAGQALGRVGLFPASQSGIGLVLLAAEPVERVEALYAGREIPGYRDVSALLTALDRVRTRGWARAARTKTNATVAVGVGDPPSSAIALAGDIPAADARRLARLLRDVSQQIEPTQPGDQS